MLGFSTATLDRRVKAGVLLTHRAGKEVLFRAADVEELKRITLGLAGDSAKTYWLAAPYLKEAREQAGISQHDLAQLSGISRAKICNFESGVTTPTLEDAAKLYGPLEERGSFNALRALVAIAAGDRNLADLTLRALEREIDSFIERHESAKTLLAELESRLTQLMTRLAERQQLEAAAPQEKG